MKQNEYLALIARVQALDAQVSFQYLSYCDEVDLAEKVLIEGIETVGPQIRKLIRAESDRFLNKRNEQQCRIMITQSRLLFGVCDHRGILKEGECAVRITLHGNGSKSKSKEARRRYAKTSAKHSAHQLNQDRSLSNNQL